MRDIYIKNCIKDLYSDDSNIRRVAAEALDKIEAPEAIGALSSVVTETIRRVRLPAVQALVLTGDERAIPALVTALRDRDAKIVRTAADGLVKFGEPAVEPVLDLLSHENWKVRLSAAEVLGRIGDKRAVPHLIKILVDEHIDVCRAAAISLRKMGDGYGEVAFQGITGDKEAINRIILDRDPRYIPLLLKALKDREWKARKFSAYLLGKLMVNESVEPLIETLRDQDSWVRQSAAEALGRLEDQKGVIPLVRTLSDIEPNVRGEAALSLGKLKAKEGVTKLIKLLKDGPSVREKAAEALGEIGEPELAEAVIELLKDTNDTVRIKAAESLGKIGSPKAVDPILKAQSKNRIPLELAEEFLKKIIGANKTAAKKHNRILCKKCLSRFTRYPRKLSFFQDYTYFACRICKGQQFIDGAKESVAILDKSMDSKFWEIKNKFFVNWFKINRPFDFEEVRIINADPFEVEEFVMKMRNDDDDWRLKRLKKIRVIVSKNCDLPQLKINLLEGTFGKVEVSKKI